LPHILKYLQTDSFKDAKVEDLATGIYQFTQLDIKDKTFLHIWWVKGFSKM